jgi:hypothetical protein
MKKEDPQKYQVNTTPALRSDSALDEAFVERLKRDLALLEKSKKEPGGWSIAEVTKGLDFSDSEKEWFCEKPAPAEDTHSWVVLKVNEGGFFRRLWRRIFGRYQIIKPKAPSPRSKIIY